MAAGGRASRSALEFEGHGIGRLLVPLVVRRQARRQLPKNEQKLKEVLEQGSGVLVVGRCCLDVWLVAVLRSRPVRRVWV